MASLTVGDGVSKQKGVIPEVEGKNEVPEAEGKIKSIRKTIEIISPIEIHQLAKDKGWWEEDRKLPELLMLMVSELSEALEAYRNNVPYGEKGCVPEELADCVIRIFDTCAAMGYDIAYEVAKKHKTNMERPHRHGGKVC